MTAEKLKSLLLEQFEEGEYETVFTTIKEFLTKDSFRKDCALLKSRYKRIQRSLDLNKLSVREAEEMICQLAEPVYRLIDKISENTIQKQ